MKLQLFEDYNGLGDYGTPAFPLFPKGTTVHDLAVDEEDDAFPHWLCCTIEGHEVFIPETFVTDGVLFRDYNPTELPAQKGEIVTLLEFVFEWAFVENDVGKTGWIPSRYLVSAP